MARTPLSSLDDNTRAAIAAALHRPKYELIPLKNADRLADLLPDGSMVSVTASESKGMDATIDLAVRLAARGHDLIPHLSARLTRDDRHLDEILTRLERAGVQRAFVVGGDADSAGPFFDGLALLEAMSARGHHLTEIGIPAYPEGHSFLPDDKLIQALHDKQPYAAYMTTQMCFSPEPIVSWIGEMRAIGVALPVQVGLPGVAPLHKLAAISARIGVGDSLRFLGKQRGLLGALVRPGGYAPDELVVELGPAIGDPDVGISGFHLYTFNQVETTERWRRAFLDALDAT